MSAPIYGPAASDQFAPVVGANSSGFLVAWIDGRSPQAAIYAARLTADGSVADEASIRIPLLSSSGNVRILGVFWIGGAYTIIYSYQTFPLLTGRFLTAVARISDRAELIESPRVVTENLLGVAAASNGSRIVIVNGASVAVLDDHARLIDQARLPGVPAYGINVGSNGSTFLVSSFSYDGSSNSVNFVALDMNGHPTASRQVAIAGIGDGPLIASDGVDYLVLYRNPYEQVAQQVSADAVVRSVSRLPETVSVFAADIIWTGSAYLFATTTTDQEQQIAIGSLDRTGKLAAPPQRVVGPGTPGMANLPRMALGGANIFATWTTGSQLSPNGLDVAGILLDRTGQPLSAAAILATSSNPQRVPVIATGGANDLVVWDEPSGIYAARVSRSGSALDGRGVRILDQARASRDFVYGQPPPINVIFDGDGYLIAWATPVGALNAQRIDPETGIQLGSRLTLAPCVTSFSLSRDALGVVVFASDCSGRLFAQRVGGAGPIGNLVVVSPAEMVTFAPRAAWNGSEWLVAWNESIPIAYHPVTVSRHQVFAQRLSSSLNVIDTTPIAVDVSGAEAASPLVATDGHDFLVVWTRRWNVPGVYARIIKYDGTFGDTAPAPGIGVAPGPNTALAVVCDGNRYAVGYTAAHEDDTYDLQLGHVTRDGALADRLPISPAGADAREGDLAVSAPGQLRAVYARTATEPMYRGVTRIFTRDVVVLRQRAMHPR